MIPDIKKLIFRYLVEPVYWFPVWLDQFKQSIQTNINQIQAVNKNGGFISGKTHIDDDGKIYKFTVPHKYNWNDKEFYIKLLEKMEHNPRATRYLIDLLDNKNTRLMNCDKSRLSQNPHHIIYKYLFSSSKLKNPNLLDLQVLALNKTTDHEYEGYILDTFISSVNSYVEQDEIEEWSILSAIYGNNIMIEMFKEEVLRELEYFDSFSDECKEHIRQKISSNTDGVAIQILKDNPNLIDYPNLCKNPGAIELLNLNPENITDHIQANPHPIIIAILSNLIDKTNFTPDSTNINIYIKMKNMDILPHRIVSNPGAIHIVEKNLYLLDLMFYGCIYSEYLDALLPNNITEIIVDELIRIMDDYDEIPQAILRCNSPHLIKFYRACSDYELNIDHIKTLVQFNDYILSEDIYGPRLVSGVLKMLNI